MRFIVLDENNMVVKTRIGEEIVESEIQSDAGECGQIRQPDGTFVTPEPPPQGPTQEERITALEEAVLTLAGI